jgi:hypothetical protein
MPIYLAQLPDGSGSIAGWADTTGRVHLTQLDRDFQRAEPDIVLDGEEIRGLAPHFDGTALLVVRGDSLYVVRVESDGTVRYDKRLIGGESHSRPGSKWVDDWGHEARLVWDGERYGVYAGHTQYFGSKGKHQGDLFWYLDSEGERIVRDNDGDWDWGCSHSLDLRLAYNGTRFGPVCLSDSYPSKGFHFAHREAEIRKEPSGDAHGRSDANLGGWVPLEDGFLMSFSSPEGRASSDVGVVFVHNDAWVGDVHWLTDTRGVDESGPHLAAYDEQFLAGWTSGRSHTIAVVDRDGSIIDGPVEIEATIQDKDDMVTMLDGSVAWAFVDGNASRLKVAQVMSCRPEAWPTTEPQPTAPASATPGGPGETPGTPGPGPTRTPAPPATPAPGQCRDILVDGDFESGLDSWDFGGEIVLRNTSGVGGHYAASFLGRNNVTAHLAQAVTVPGGTTSLFLSFRWKMETAEGPNEYYDEPSDLLEFGSGRRGSGKHVETISHLSGRDSWRLTAHEVPVEAASGVWFEASGDRRNATRFYVDDVQLLACNGVPPGPARVAVDPASGAAGTTFAATASGFGPGELVSLWVLEPGSLNRFDVARLEADAAGQVQADFNVRTVAGTWTLNAAGVDSRLPASTTFEVTAP